MPSKPPSRTWVAARQKESATSLISSISISLGTSRNMKSGTGGGGGMDGLLLGDDKAGAAFSALRQVVHVAFGGEVPLGEVGKVGGKGDAVGNGYLADAA